jgi:hypothetical protein
MTGIKSPPASFDQITLLTLDIDANTLVRMAWPDPATHCKFRNEMKFRFDAPDGSFGVLYAAFDVATAFAETVLRDKPALATAAAVILDYAEVESRHVVQLKSGTSPRRLRLIKLFDDGLAAARIDNRIATVDDYAVTQLWAKAFYHHPIGADGIIYMSRYMGARKSVAIFDRARSAVEVGSATRLLEHGEFADLVTFFQLAIDKP